MLQFILQNIAPISLLISFIALLCSFYSILKTNKANRIQVKIEHSEYCDYPNHFRRMSFNLMNNSPISITIKKVTLLNQNEQPIKTINIDVDKMYDAIDQIRTNKSGLPFNVFSPAPIIDYDSEEPNDLTATTLTPYNSAWANFYTYEKLDLVLLSVKCEEKISFFRHKKAFLVHMLEHPQDFNI